MNAPDDLRIAGRKTVGDWKVLRRRLEGSNDRDLWTVVFDDFFKARLESRYFKPIRTLEAMRAYDGEGFAIVALQCSLIEFLASTLSGKSYRHRRENDPPLEKYEYSKSGKVFTGFLRTQMPFRESFPTKDSASDFYKNVRCALFHEARTRNGWRIRADGNPRTPVDAEARIVYRHKMGAAFDAFTGWYGEQLQIAPELQAAFLRKFDSLCVE